MALDGSNEKDRGSSPVGRGAAGVYIEGELGGFYLLAMLAALEPRGLPGNLVDRVQFQGVEHGYALDDLIIHGTGDTLLEIQSKRTITFAPRDPIFKEVCEQIARSESSAGEDSGHLFAVATQRTSFAISGPYQDVLQWAQTAETAAMFFARVSAEGVAGKQMRDFVATFRANLITAGIANDNEAIWRIVRRFQILEFDFESSSPLATTYALSIARQVLSDDDFARAKALWANLIELSLATGKTGGSINRAGLREQLIARGFHLAGERDFSLVRAKLAEMARLALADIGNTVAGIHLPRLGAVAALDEAREQHRLIEIRGGPGVGKSAVLRHVAERISRESHVIVLDPISTPEGGWGAFSLQLGVPGTVREFLNDLAASGGGVLFIDSLDMFTSPERRRTVNDLLREISAIEGFSVLATARRDFGHDGDNWLAEDAITALGAPRQIIVQELNDTEVEALQAQAPELRALLMPGHPAAHIARNLYRLSRLLKVPTSEVIRTEAALAAHWWRTADGAVTTDIRSAQRLLADLADAALAGSDLIEARNDSPARTHLLDSQTLSENRRDHLAFYHDVLRDWAIGSCVHEDLNILAQTDLSAPVSPRVARGIEFAGRFMLEMEENCGSWLALLARLSLAGSHGSWRRQALMAIVRTELSPALLERCHNSLFAEGGSLLSELCIAIMAVDTVPAAELFEGVPLAQGQKVPQSLRVATSSSAPTLLCWCTMHADEIPLTAIGSVTKLIEIQFFTIVAAPEFAKLVAKMLFEWLLQLDVRNAKVSIPMANDGLGSFGGRYNQHPIEELRTMSLLLATHARDDTKAYLKAIATENDLYKIKEIRPLSKSLAQVAPDELAMLILGSLVEPMNRRSSGREGRYRALSFADTDYMPPSPAQAPFLDLLEASSEIGLELIRRLTQEAVSYRFDGIKHRTDGFMLVFESGPRFFPWVQTYYWSRDQAQEYSVASALMALEAWGHDRLDRGESVEAVLSDVLGPEGSCAAFLLIAIDLLISHWPATRSALVPFIACPELLAKERGREIHDRLNRTRTSFRAEPSGRVQLANLAARPSRGLPLEQLLPGYLEDDEDSHRARSLLAGAVAALGSYEEDADFGDPAFMGTHALNLLNRDNWVQYQDRLEYRSPPEESRHLARLDSQRGALLRSSEIEAKIQLATNDPTNASAAVAREAAEYAEKDLPDDNDPDVLKAKSTRLVATARLVARDGDDALFNEYEAWARAVIARTLEEKPDRAAGSGDQIAFNRPALAISALIHLWRRHQHTSDRDTLIDAIARIGRYVVPAFEEELDVILAIDPRVLKSAMRVAFTTCRWRWHPWDEDDAVEKQYELEKARTDQLAVAAEIAWLAGEQEPAWPEFPEERPTLRHSFRLQTPDGNAPPEIDDLEADETAAAETAKIHINSQATARWLRILTKKPATPLIWSGEIVRAYADWTVKANGYGFPQEAEVEHILDEWNSQFYDLFANEILNASATRFEELLHPIETLPDQAFSSICETLIHAADVRYFNDATRPPDRPISLRSRLVTRTMTLWRWNVVHRADDLSIDHDMGSIIAKLLMNTHNPFGRTESYLVPAVFDRIDPLLEPLRILMPGGPIPFIALCTMNTLLVAPRARHLDFLLSGVEAWLARVPEDEAMWIRLGIGRKVIDWFNSAIAVQPGLLGHQHPQRGRLDTVLGKLVSIGVPEAHELEKRIEGDSESAPQL